MLENTFNHQHDSDDAYHYWLVSTLQIIGVWQLVHDENKLQLRQRRQTKIPHLFIIKSSARFVAT